MVFWSTRLLVCTMIRAGFPALALRVSERICFCILFCRVKGATINFLKLGVREKPVSVLKSPATSSVMSF